MREVGFDPFGFFVIGVISRTKEKLNIAGIDWKFARWH
jgi:hypothetical protein